MLFDWHMLYPLHTVILNDSQVFGGVLCKAQLWNFSKWFFSPRFGVVPIWELWQFCYVRIGPPKYSRHRRSSLLPLAPAPKRPCPTPQFGSLLKRQASQSAPPPQRPQFGSLLRAPTPPQRPRTSARCSNFQLFGNA